MSEEQEQQSGKQEFVTSGEEAGARLDVVLQTRLGIGRAQVKKLLESGRVRVNGRRVGLGHKGEKLAAGTRVEVVEFERPGEERVVAEPETGVRLLAEGKGWVAVEKPAGVAVHPLVAGERGTVLNAVVARWPGVQGVGEGGLRSGVVHRLDVETSGVVLFATEQEAWKRLRAAFAEHSTRKVYRAVVEGKLSGERREVMELAVAQHRPARVKVVKEATGESRRCDLRWRAVEALKGATLVEVELGTGFLHQIRVMMAHLGHPIVGDRVYGGAMKEAAPRQMLHAGRIEIPIMGVKAVSKEPGDFSGAVNRLRS